MRVRLVLAILALMGFLLPASEAAAFCNPHSPPAGTTACLNNPTDHTCSQLGETTADGDNVNIIACLKTSPADPTPTWKAMSSGGGGGVPPGTIIMWSGTLASIPDGWHLCDGTAGTPDLRSKIVQGAAAGSNPTSPGYGVRVNGGDWGPISTPGGCFNQSNGCGGWYAPGDQFYAVAFIMKM